MDFLLQTEGDGLDRWSLFCYALISGGGKGATMSKFLSYEDRIILAQRLQENASFGAIGKELGKDRTTIAKEIKKYSHDKKSGRPGYPITLVNSVLHAKQKNCAEQVALISQRINAVCALSARFTVRIL